MCFRPTTQEVAKNWVPCGCPKACCLVVDQAAAEKCCGTVETARDNHGWGTNWNQGGGPDGKALGYGGDAIREAGLAPCEMRSVEPKEAAKPVHVIKTSDPVGIERY